MGNGIRVYRNYGDGTWTLEWAETGSGTKSVIVAQGLAGELRVYDIAGRQVMGVTVSVGAAYPLPALDGNDIPVGVYVAVLNTPSQTLSTVFVRLGD